MTQTAEQAQSVPKPGYVGRFAPSPTGELHFGSLLAAVASRLQALAAGGQWRLRIDDLDGPRCDPAYSASILKTLASYGCDWHGEVVYQSQRRERYQATMQALLRADSAAVYRCNCGRRQLNQTAQRGDAGLIYPGYCRRKSAAPFGEQIASEPADELAGDYALRVTVPNERQSFTDGWQGRLTRNLALDDGDFVVWRRDHLPAYHLAVVVDDADLGVTESVRGIDLLLTTPRQIFLQQQLGLPTPAYRHLPVAVNPAGDKLSKMTRAPAINELNPASTLTAALAALQQQPPAALQHGSIAECWQWALANWRPERLDSVRSVEVTDPVLLE